MRCQPRNPETQSYKVGISELQGFQAMVLLPVLLEMSALRNESCGHIYIYIQIKVYANHMYIYIYIDTYT